MNKRFAAVVVLFILFSVVLSRVMKPATVQAAENLMTDVPAKKPAADAQVSKDFIRSQTAFSVRLFQKTAIKDKNTLISPVSVSLALGMTANGAGGTTLKQFENVLGGNIAEMNQNSAILQNRLQSIQNGKFQVANSIWFRNQNLKVEKDFLQKNADYYGTGAFQLDFSNPSAPDKINGWVKENTGGKIDKMVEKIDKDTMLYLMNALYFEADWKNPYYKYDVQDGTFHSPAKDRTVSFLHSDELYLHDGGAQGILKPFKDSRFAFAAILPNSGTDLSTYVSKMTGDSFTKLIGSSDKETAVCSFPKLKYEYGTELNGVLKALGLTDAFDDRRADFSPMGSSPNGPLFISSVLHKTFIQVDELGAKAGAATKVEIAAKSSMPIPDQKKIVFDRPFLFAIVDTETNIPVFMGAAYNP